MTENKIGRTTIFLEKSFLIFLLIVVSASFIVFFQWSAHDRSAGIARAVKSATRKEKTKTDAATEHANWLYYANQIAGAQRALDLGDPISALQYLDRCPKELRDWEYRLLHHSAMRGSRTLTGHQGPVRSLAWSRDGRFLVTGGGANQKPGELVLWNTQTSKIVRRFEGHTESVTCVAFNRDGSKVASGSFDHTVRIWDVQTGKIITSFKFPSHVEGYTRPLTAVEFNPNGERILCAAQARMPRIFDATTGEEIIKLGDSPFGSDVNAVAFSPDGTNVVGGESSQKASASITVWDAATGEPLTSFEGQGGAISSLAFSPTGDRILSGGPTGINVWASTDGSNIARIKEDVRCVAFSPDGAKIVAAGGALSRPGTVKLWSPTDGKQLDILTGHKNAVWCSEFSFDGKFLATGDWGGELRIWPVNNWESLLSLNTNGGPVNALAISHDNRRIVSGSGTNDGVNEVQVWDLNSREKTYSTPHNAGIIGCVAFSPDGKLIAAGDRVDRILPREFFEGGTGSPCQLTLLDAETGKVRHILKGHQQLIAGVAFSPDSQRIASASWDKSVKVWDTLNGDELLTLEDQKPSPFCSVAFTSDSQWIIAATRSGLMRYDANTGQQKSMPLKGRIGSWFTSHVTAEAEWLLTYGAIRNPKIVIWNVAQERLLSTFEGHTSTIVDALVIPNSNRVASVSSDRTLKIWDLRTGHETLTLPIPDTTARSLAISPDGNWIACGCADGTIRLWNDGVAASDE